MMDIPRKKRRGPRAAVACDSCRTRRVKCDGTLPCSSCIDHGFECSYKGKPQHKTTSHPQTPTSLFLNNPRPIAAKRGPSPLAHRDNDPSQRTPGFGTAPISTPGPSLLAKTLSEPSQLEKPGSVSSPRNQRELEGLTETNHHTEGSEFYGPTGTFYFVSSLRSQAHSQDSPEGSKRSEVDHRQGQGTSQDSVVNLLHSSDYPIERDYRKPIPPSDLIHQQRQTQIQHLPPTLGRSDISSVSSDAEIQRECVRLYFQNLHCIHPILDQSEFVQRCEREAWAPSVRNSQVDPRGRSRFFALFNIVLALGAITAGESSMLLWESSIKSIEQAERHGNAGTAEEEMTTVYPPIRAARLFFNKSKHHLGDVFESSSFETAQTLLLMAVFCQNALKPHSCYMYSGVALRTALAIGIPTSGKSHTQAQRLFWWALYSHDIEMCSSAGRLSFLREPRFYSIALPSEPISDHRINCPSTRLVNCMIDLAQILCKIPTDIHVSDTIALSKSFQRSTELESQLLEWRSSLPTELNFGLWSLQENELVTKQKIVLKLRFLNTKILLRRPFLVSGAANPRPEWLSEQTMACVEAARETINFVHDTYLHRPYFRTWWYNCTYVLDATMVLLYAIIHNIHPSSNNIYPPSNRTTSSSDVHSVSNSNNLFSDVEKSLEIYNAMETLTVARRCAEITRDVLDIAKRSQQERCDQPRKTEQHRSLSSPLLNRNSESSFRDRDTTDFLIDGADEDFGLYAGLVDSNMAFKFLNFEDWSAWSAEGFE